VELCSKQEQRDTACMSTPNQSDKSELYVLDSEKSGKTNCHVHQFHHEIWKSDDITLTIPLSLRFFSTFRALSRDRDLTGWSQIEWSIEWSFVKLFSEGILDFLSSGFFGHFCYDWHELNAGLVLLSPTSAN
jgi:hypothetical protein